MAFCGTLLFYRWTAATPLNEAPSVVQDVIIYFTSNCVNLRIPHRVTIKDAQDEGTDCALVNLWGVDDLHCMKLHDAFVHGPMHCRIDPGSGLPASAVAFLPDGGPFIDPGCQEMELMDLVKQRYHSTLSALRDLVLQVGPHINWPRQKRRWRADAAQLMAAERQAAAPIPVNAMKFPLASVEYLSWRIRDYHLLEAELAARCTADSGEGVCEGRVRRQCATLMAIIQLARELMEAHQGQRSAEIMEQAVVAQAKRQSQPSQADLLDGRRGKRARCNRRPCW